MVSLTMTKTDIPYIYLRHTRLKSFKKRKKLVFFNRYHQTLTNHLGFNIFFVSGNSYPVDILKS